MYVQQMKEKLERTNFKNNEVTKRDSTSVPRVVNLDMKNINTQYPSSQEICNQSNNLYFILYCNDVNQQMVLKIELKKKL